MMTQDKVISSMTWLGIGQIVSISIAFISNIILARLLSPDDFGYIGMLSIFLSISAIFVNGGFGMAIIQKENITNIDCTTVFWWNLFVSICCIFILFFAAPYIADFYGLPPLENILRVLSIDLFLTALAIVPTNIMKKCFHFKQLAVRTIVSCIIATTVCICCAFAGLGIWSLVVLNLLKSLIIAIMLWNMTDWRPTIQFSIESWKRLFGFGGMMLLSSIISSLYTNINGLLIGKFFSAGSLGYYIQAKKLEEVPTLSATSVINEVSFSAFSSVQNQMKVFISALRKNCICIAFLYFPIFLLAIDLAPYLIRLLFSEKWVPAVPYFQMLCASGIVFTLNSIYESSIKSLGKGSLYFISFSVNKFVGLCLILMGIPYGILGMLVGMLLANYLTLFVNMVINSYITGYHLIQQLKDIIVYLLYAVIALFCSHFVQSLPFENILLILFEIIIFFSVYLFLSHVTQLQGIKLFIDIIKKRYVNDKYTRKE